MKAFIAARLFGIETSIVLISAIGPTVARASRLSVRASKLAGFGTAACAFCRTVRTKATGVGAALTTSASGRRTSVTVVGRGSLAWRIIAACSSVFHSSCLFRLDRVADICKYFCEINANG